MSQSSDRVQMVVGPEEYRSDAPSTEQIIESLMTLQPGESFSIPVLIGPGTKGLPVEVHYGVSEAFGRKFGIWHGEVSAKSGPIVE